MRKILILFLLILSACTNTISDNSVLYMDGISEGNLFDYLSDELKTEFKAINNAYSINDYVLKSIGRDLSDRTFTDYYGNTIQFKQSGKVIIEAVAYWCPSCKKQVPKNEELISKYSDITFYQCFNEGDKQEIDEFYKDNKMPDEITIIPYDEDLSAYLMSFDPEYYPTYFFFEDGVCTYVCHGDLDLSRMNLLYNKAFSFKKEELLTNDGKSIFDVYINETKLFESLSPANREKLNSLSRSKDITMQIMAKEVYYNDLYQNEDALYSLEDFSSYIDANALVFYLSIMNLEENIEIINKFIDAHPDIKVLTILSDNDDMNTSKEYEKLNIGLKGDISSSIGYLPKTMADMKVSYPMVVYIENNRYMGGFSELEEEKLEKGLNIFIGEGSIARKENN